MAKITFERLVNRCDNNQYEKAAHEIEIEIDFQIS